MTTTAVPTWTLEGDWFDVCTCNIACPCEFAQAPTDNKCAGVLAYKINSGSFGDTDMAGLAVIALISFEGDLWAGETKCTVGLLVDDKASPAQLEGIQAIFGGAGGGWPGAFAQLIGDFRGVEIVPITMTVADDLSSWSVEASGKVKASAVALTGPTADPTRRVQLINPPGSEVGPQGPGDVVVATWGVGEMSQAQADLFGDFNLNKVKTSSKHIAFKWSGPDA
jgi:hypothetical protein